MSRRNKSNDRAAKKQRRKIHHLMERANEAGAAICEVVDEAFSGVTITEAVAGKKIIENVRILGGVSKNNRVYPETTMREAIDKINGARVYIDHPSPTDKGVGRSMRDLAGTIRNAKVVEGAVRGDIAVGGPASSILLECATNASHACGLSINANGTQRNGDNGQKVVESITRVVSVDLVDRPATNDNLFESDGTPIIEGPVADQVKSAEQNEHLRNIVSATDRLAWDTVYSRGDSKITHAQMVARLKAIYTDAAKEVAKAGKADDATESITEAETGAEGDGEMKMEDLTLKMLESERSDLVEAITKESAAKVAAAEKERDEAKAKLSEREKNDAAIAMADKLLKESKIPEKAKTSKLRESLIANGTEDGMKSMLEAVAEVVGAAGSTKPTSEAANPLNDGRDTLSESDDGKPDPSLDFSCFSAAGK